MKAILTGWLVFSSIMAVCMGAADFRAGAIVMAIIAAAFAALREASQ
ncbi:UNVERIFIED_ORG: hypothetical protein GGD59_002220 [Rhizobium esperanzae]